MYNETPSSYEPNDMGGATFTILSDDRDPLVVDGLNRVTAAFTDDDFTLTRAGSGMTAVNRIRSSNGTVEIEVLDSSESMDILSEMANDKKPLSFTFTDPITPKLNCSSSYCFVTKHPDIVRQDETQMSVFSFLCPVLTAKTGGFTVKIVS
jgi:hypothetical protein